MKRFLLAGLLVIAISASHLEEQGAQFQAFKLKHGKIYKNQAEETKRFTIFKENLEKVTTHNARYKQGLETYKLAMNKFADITVKEFAAMLGTQKALKLNLNITETFKMPEGIQAPASFDWRQQNVITPVKDQGFCGSCWAFAITGSIEAAYAQKTGELVSLSEQQLVDCTTDVNLGCKGGYLPETFPYIIKNGLQSENSYPYLEKDSSCKYQASDVVARVNSYVTVNNDEETLKNVVGTIGPVSITINADYIQLYDSGILDKDRCSLYSSNHAVLIVGYGSDSGIDYWTLKNSWGADWGENGYFRFKYGVNECKMAEDTVYPVIN